MNLIFALLFVLIVRGIFGNLLDNKISNDARRSWSKALKFQCLFYFT